jgi:actin-related protein
LLLGYVIPNGVCKVDFAGDDLTRFLTNILHQHGYSLKDHHQAQLFKEQFCKINFASMSAGADSSHTTTASTDYMSSSNKIYNVVRDELFDCGEAVFKSIRKYYILTFHHIFF